jgi:hypothetical protein
MGTIVLRVDLLLLWGGLYVVGTILLVTWSWVVDPTGVLGAAIVAVTWAITIGGLLWTRGRGPVVRDRPDRGTPLPGPSGLFRVDLPEGASVRPGVAPVPEPPPVCPRCGRLSKVGELNCANCGTSLWSGGPSFSLGGTGSSPP